MSKVYVGTYAKYNSGNLAGEWLDLEDYSDKDEFLEACTKLHEDEIDPELMFQDWEEIPEGFISESYIDADLWDWLELDEDDRNMLAAYREEVDSSGTLEQARDAFRGTADSELDYTYQYIDDTGVLSECPEDLQQYFDYEAFARDLFIGDLTLVKYEGTGYVFSNR